MTQFQPMDLGRMADLDYLVERRKFASEAEKKSIDESINQICNESGLIRSMRERLIRETRAGRTENVKDIREWILNKQKKGNSAWA